MSVPASPVPMNTWSVTESTAASTVVVGRTDENDELEYEMPTTCGVPGLSGVKGLPGTCAPVVRSRRALRPVSLTTRS